MAPDIDQAEMDLDDAIQNLCDYAAQLGDERLKGLVDCAVLQWDQLLDLLDGSVALNLEQPIGSVEH